MIDKNNEINKQALIYTAQNISALKSVDVLEDGQIYIYVMLNYPQGNIKIGKTTNIQQRLMSLSGSNGGGNRIVKLYLSPTTWMDSIEHAFHNYYHKYRISGTEWFDGSKLNFNDVVEQVNSKFNSEEFKVCNKLRKQFIDKKKEKDKLLLKEQEKKEQDEAILSSTKKKKKSKAKD